MAFKRVVVTGKGGPEVIQVVEAEREEPGPGQVRLRVEASGVAFADIMARRGAYPGLPPHPYTPGYDVVGVVDKLADGVTGFAPGQRAGALMLGFGACAEFVTVPEEMLVPVPQGMDPGEAVSLFLNYLTAWQLLYEMAQVQPGERALVTSAAGGVGTALLQLGKRAGLELIGTASSGKLALVAELGAIPVDYRSEDVVQRLGQDGKGLDVIFDGVGGKTVRRAYRLLGKDGRLVRYGFLSLDASNLVAFLPAILETTWLRLLPDGRRVLFNQGLPEFVAQNKGWYRQIMAELFRLLEQGAIRPVIGKRLPLQETAQAHRLLETGAVQGKIVLLAQG